MAGFRNYLVRYLLFADYEEWGVVSMPKLAISAEKWSRFSIVTALEGPSPTSTVMIGLAKRRLSMQVTSS